MMFGYKNSSFFADKLKPRAFKGSASMVFMSLAFLTLLLAANVSLSGLQKDLTTVGLEGKETSSLESIANGALQEVLATRFYPASNRLNWQFNHPHNSASNSSSLKPFFKKSSFIFKENSSDLMARYQYVVIGGHPARQVGTVKNYINSSTEAGYNQLIDPESTNVQTPFYVLLRTVACTNKQSLAMMPNTLYAKTDGQPNCGTPASLSSLNGGNPNNDFVLKQYDLLAKVILNPSNALTNPDKYQVVYTKQVDFGSTLETPIGLDDAVLLPKKSNDSESVSTSTSTSTPTYGQLVRFANFWPTSLSFPNGQSASMANLERVLLETYDAKQTLLDVTAGSHSVNDVPVSNETKTKLHLYFRGPMDSRSFYQYQYNSAVNADGIITDPAKLNIQLTPYYSSSSLLGGATFDFNYPSADHLTITLNQNFACSQTYELSFPTATTSLGLTRKIKDSYGVSATGTFTTTFNTVDCPPTGDYN